MDWCLTANDGREPRLLKSVYLDDGALAAHNARLDAKYAAMQAEARAESLFTDDAELVVVAFGSMGRIARSTVSLATDELYEQVFGVVQLLDTFWDIGRV